MTEQELKLVIEALSADLSNARVDAAVWRARAISAGWGQPQPEDEHEGEASG